MKTIYILWLRQLKRYFRSKSRMVGSLGQPVLFLVAMGFGFGPIFQRAGGGNYIEFLAPGVICMGILFTSIFSGMEIIWDRQFGFLKETLVAPVSRMNIMLGRTMGGATVASIQGFIVFLLAVLVGFRPVSWAMVPVAVLFMFIAAFMFTALSTAIASRLEDMQAFPLITNFLAMPMFFLSGALFPLKGLPRVIEGIARVNPLSYSVDALRGALSGASHFGLHYDIIVILCVTALFLAVGSWLFSKIEI